MRRFLYFLLFTFHVSLFTGSPASALDPGPFDQTVWANEDYYLNLTHKANGIPIDLTGYQFKMQGKKSGAAAPFVTFSSAIVNPANGTTRHWLSRRATLDRINQAGVYDLMQIAPDGTVSYRMMGKIVFRETTTR